MASEIEKNKTPEERQKEAAARANSVQSQSKIATDDVERTPEEEKRVIAEKIAAALIAQGKKDVPQEELEKLVNYYYEKQRKAKEAKLETDETSNHASTMSDDMKPTTSNTVESSNSNSVNLSATDIDNSKKNHDGEFGLPQDASSALESLTDADLQTLLQNFEDLSAEEQQHLHTYMKKLEASDPTRVEKLRKYVKIAFNTNDTNNQNEKIDDYDKHIETKYASKISSKAASNTDMFYDDTRDKNKQISTIIDSDDDDDYEYDDLCKATSKKLKENELQIEQNSPEIISDGSPSIKPDQFILGNEMLSRNDDISNSSSRGENSNLRPDLKSAESIIANIMGSLQKNVQSRSFNDHNQTDTINSDMKNQAPRHQIQSNIPFYQQQQLQQQQQSNAYNQSYNNGSDQMPNLNNQFFANEFNLGNQNMFNNNQSQNYNNTRPNIPAFGQQQPQLTNQQFALLAQMQQEMSQQQNNRQMSNNQFNSNNAYGRSYR